MEVESKPEKTVKAKLPNRKNIGPRKTFRDTLFNASSNTIGREKTKFFFKMYDFGKF